MAQTGKIFYTYLWSYEILMSFGFLSKKVLSTWTLSGYFVTQSRGLRKFEMKTENMSPGCID